MSIEYKRGDLFTSDCRVLVNPTNCVGPMGAGLAKQFRDKYPGLESRYKELCREGLVRPGMLFIYPVPGRRILNFPTKNHWKNPSQMLYLEEGLDKFILTYKEKRITDIAFPLLGAGLGGLDKHEVVTYMTSRLRDLEDIRIEIWS